jgi:Dolichyl-phosphate-mannose-protein mannosyltransferase
MNILSPCPKPGIAAWHRIRWSLWVPLLAFVLYGFMLARYSAAYAGGADSSGYMNDARLLDHGKVIAPMRQVSGLNPEKLPPNIYVPLCFMPRADRVNMAPIYSMGLPVLVMAVAHVVGWDLAPTLTAVLHALLGLWLVYLLGREAGLEPGWAWIGTMVLAASPVFILMSLEVMSDVPALAWVTAAVLWAWKSRKHPPLALAAGVALSFAVLVRPTNLLAFLPVGIALGIGIRRWLLLIAGGLPGAVFLGIVNATAYGRVFTTGYGGVGALFSASNVPVTLLHYAIWLPALFTPLVVLSLGLPVLRRSQPLVSALLCIWALVFLGCYLLYCFTHETWWYLRFILPAVPPLLVAALLVARALAGRWRLAVRASWLVWATFVLFIAGRFWFRHFNLAGVDSGERTYIESALWLESHAPANAVVVSMQTSGAIFYYTEFPIVRWDVLSSAQFEYVAGVCAEAGRPIYASLYRFEIEEEGAFRQHLTDHWTRIAKIHDAGIWRYDPLSVQAPPPSESK